MNLKKICLFFLLSTIISCSVDEPVKIESKIDLEPTIAQKEFYSSVTLHFDYGVVSLNSGCTKEKLGYDGNFFTYTGVYGPIPQPQEEGYMIRGYNKPYHNEYYNSLALHSSNEGRQTISPRTGQLINDNDPRVTAISIEYPFLANTTYEISVQNYFVDVRKNADNVYSDGYPTLTAYLKETPEIPGPNPCGDSGLTGHWATVDGYIYKREQTLDSHALITRTFIYKFSPIENKNALVLILSPSMASEVGAGVSIPTNNYVMLLPLITIAEKPFDPSINVAPPPRGGGRI